MTDERLFVWVSEVAEELQCDPRTVSRGIEQGVIPAVRIGRMVRIPVRAFCEAVRIDAEVFLAKLAEKDAAGATPASEDGKEPSADLAERDAAPPLTVVVHRGAA